MHPVVLHHVELIDAEFLGKFRNGHGQREVALGCAVTLIGAGRADVAVVGVDGKAHVLARIERQRERRAVARHRQGVVAVRACVGAKIHLDGGDGAIFLGPHFHLHLGHVAGGVADELLFTGVAEGNRAAGHPGRPGAHLFQQDILLGAKAAPTRSLITCTWCCFMPTMRAT